ncbi:biliverdin-producing heme oxygenase [Erythrobacter sp. GH1-10]|uniref:biliverdin-producing heme oxygenase n=1 Tax=Erythrobacter sp. GH1-10 TaxID=3349334 RepID=UPI003877D419
MRTATASSHERLDHEMRSASGWGTHADYARFLGLQYGARLPVERWLSTHARDWLRPPEQCALIARDLDNLDAEAPEPGAAFRIAPEAGSGREAQALGVAWVLAGSSLGNRAIVSELARKGRGHWPKAFLGDPAMLAFWKRLRPSIEVPADASTIASASRAAVAVFDHFIAHAASATGEPQRRAAIVS